LKQLIEMPTFARRGREVATHFEGVDAIGTACALIEELFATHSGAKPVGAST
jgi:hypothetical protein